MLPRRFLSIFVLLYLFAYIMVVAMAAVDSEDREDTQQQKQERVSTAAGGDSSEAGATEAPPTREDSSLDESPVTQRRLRPSAFYPHTKLHLEGSSSSVSYMPPNASYNPVRDYLHKAEGGRKPTYSVEQYLRCVYHMSYMIDPVNSKFHERSGTEEGGGGEGTGAEEDRVPLPSWCRPKWIPKEELFQGMDSVVLIGDSTMLRLFHDIVGTDPTVYYVKLTSIPDRLNGTLVLAEEAAIPTKTATSSGLGLKEPISKKGTVGGLVQEILDDEVPTPSLTEPTTSRYKGRVLKVFFLRSKNIIDAGKILERGGADGIITRNSLVITSWGTHDFMWLTHRMPPPQYRKKMTGSWSYAKGYWNKHVSRNVHHIGYVMAQFANTSIAGRGTHQKQIGTVPRSRLEWDGTAKTTPLISPGTRFDAPILVQKEIPSPPCDHFKYANRPQISRCPDTLKPAVVPWHQHSLAVLMGYAWALPMTTLEPLTPLPCNLIDAGHFDRRWKVAELQMLVQAYRLSRRLGITQGPLGGPEALLGRSVGAKRRPTPSESVPSPLVDVFQMGAVLGDMNMTTYYYNRFAANIPPTPTTEASLQNNGSSGGIRSPPRVVLPAWAHFADIHKGSTTTLESLLTRVPMVPPVPGVGAVRIEIPRQDVPGTDLSVFNTVVAGSEGGRLRHDLLIASYYHHSPSDSLFVMHVDRDVRSEAIAAAERSAITTARSRSDFGSSGGSKPKKHHTSAVLVDDDPDRLNRTMLDTPTVNISDYEAGGSYGSQVAELSAGAWRLALPPTVHTGVFSLSQLIVYSSLRLTGEILTAKGLPTDDYRRLRGEVLAGQRLATRGMPAADSPFFDSPLGKGLKKAQLSGVVPSVTGPALPPSLSSTQLTPGGIRADSPFIMLPILVGFMMLLVAVLRRQRRQRQGSQTVIPKP